MNHSDRSRAGGTSADDAREFVAMISILPSQVSDPVEIAFATRDAIDDYLIALAREHDAVWIVTGDHDAPNWEAPVVSLRTPRSHSNHIEIRRSPSCQAF